MAENMFNWQFNTIPGLANQGAILMTRNDITEPPFQQSDFIWKAMEDVIGVANVKFEYDEVKNKYHIYKAKGHQNNQGQWSYTWEKYGTWDALPEEVVETLRAMTYIQYRFVTQDVLGNTILTIYGVRKTGVEDVIANITFVSKTYVDNTIDALRQNLMVYINKKWEYKSQVSTKTNLPASASFGNVYLVEDESDLYINISETSTPSWKPFTQIAENFTAYAIELHKGTNGLYAQLRYDSIDFLIDSAQNLKAQIIDDTLDASSPLANRKTYSIDKILQILSSSMRYKGQVNYYDLLPTTGNNTGDTWNVMYSGTSSQGGTDLDGDNYCWNGTSWDDLSGEYRAGVGIQIVGKVISATGISFNVGSGIQIVGSGSNAILQTRNGKGLDYENIGTSANPIYANMVKAGNGIVVDSNGVKANTDNTTIKVNTNNQLEVILPVTGQLLAIANPTSNIDFTGGSNQSTLILSRIKQVEDTTAIYLINVGYIPLTQRLISFAYDNTSNVEGRFAKFEVYLILNETTIQVGTVTITYPKIYTGASLQGSVNLNLTGGSFTLTGTQINAMLSGNNRLLFSYDHQGATVRTQFSSDNKFILTATKI